MNCDVCGDFPLREMLQFYKELGSSGAAVIMATEVCLKKAFITTPFTVYVSGQSILVIESFLCFHLSVCLSLSTLTAELFDIGTEKLIKRLMTLQTSVMVKVMCQCQHQKRDFKSFLIWGSPYEIVAIGVILWHDVMTSRYVKEEVSWVLPASRCMCFHLSWDMDFLAKGLCVSGCERCVNAGAFSLLHLFHYFSFLGSTFDYMQLNLENCSSLCANLHTFCLNWFCTD